MQFLLDCGSVPTVLHGNVTLNNPLNTTYGAEATVSCDPGYNTTLSTLICKANAAWDVPTCTVIGKPIHLCFRKTQSDFKSYLESMNDFTKYYSE